MGLSVYMSYRQVGPQLKEYRKIVSKMEEEGASDKEILEFMNEDTGVDKSKLIATPLWMNIVVALAIVASLVLLILVT